MTGFRFSDLPWRAKASYVAHIFKAAVKQHHGWMKPLFTPFVEAESVVFDIGGHSGQYAKLLARIAKRGRVYSFEPSSYACSILRFAVRVNGLTNIVVVPKGLGDKPSSLTLNTPLKPKGTFRFGLAHMSEFRESGPVHREEVALTTIDHFAADEGLQRLDFIKIDVEGWEMRILEGGATTIGYFRPVMLIELVDQHLARASDSLEAVWRLLESWDYRPTVCFDGKVLTPIEAPREGDFFWLPD